MTSRAVFYMATRCRGGQGSSGDIVPLSSAACCRWPWPIQRRAALHHLVQRRVPVRSAGISTSLWLVGLRTARYHQRLTKQHIRAAYLPTTLFAVKGTLEPAGHNIRQSRFRRRSSTIVRMSMGTKPKELTSSRDNAHDLSEPPPRPTLPSDISDVTVVGTHTCAERVLRILQSSEVRSRYHACDTEVTDIAVKDQSPVGNGRVTCVTIFAGEDVDFGNGPRLFIDVLDGEPGLLSLFADYFEDQRILKVWHNYGFDRHVLFNHGIDCLGFGADTMHMARLWHSARRTEGGYSLEALSNDLLGGVGSSEMNASVITSNKKVERSAASGSSMQAFAADAAVNHKLSARPPLLKKTSMKELFARGKLKRDGTEGKTMYLPDTQILQQDPSSRDAFIDYACHDACVTWHLREKLEQLLRKQAWGQKCTMWDFYVQYWRPFGELLTDMEREGFFVHKKDYLPGIEARAVRDRDAAEIAFRKWASSLCPGAQYMNIKSAQQKQYLFFAPYQYEDDKHSVSLPAEKEFNVDRGALQLLRDVNEEEIPSTFVINGFGLPARNRTARKLPSVSAVALKELAGNLRGADEPQYGAAFALFGGGSAGRRACEGIDALCQVTAIETMLATFIRPLQEQTDASSRIHCSLNLNTETGRLSARRPNLQNQPALEKDIYKVRRAFAAAPGKLLLVADYGQLELRVLAVVTKCRSMIEAFRSGGDFHSRTAMGMYPHVKQAVDEGTVLLERGEGEASDIPLLKDMFASERRKAKVLNFSIAYGKTAKGLSNDWGVSEEEARETLERWYADRPEVRAWQQRTIEKARSLEYTQTMMGRYRFLPSINDRSASVRNHSERAAINTPIQGGAADVVMMAMLKLHAHVRFRELGWKMILQVHDEIVAEGPEQSAEEAKQILVQCMEKPFRQELEVALSVDAKVADNWYDAK